MLLLYVDFSLESLYNIITLKAFTKANLKEVVIVQ